MAYIVMACIVMGYDLYSYGRQVPTHATIMPRVLSIEGRTFTIGITFLTLLTI